MIQIDDAGSGSLIGGTAIGVYCSKREQYEFHIIPIKYFQSVKLYQAKEYQNYVVKVCRRLFQKWKIDQEEKIEVCPSYVFEELRKWLNYNKFNWKTEKITGKLQENLSKSFFDYLISFGLPEKYLKHTRYAYGFHHLLQWVYADKEKREKFCKTCWKSYQKWGYKQINAEKKVTIDKSQMCLKCGKDIMEKTAIVIFYESKKIGKIYFHNSCYH